MLAVALVVLAGCGPEEAATPSPAATRAWTGPLLVYTRDVRSVDTSSRISYAHQVVTYDVGAKREIASLDGVQAILAGDKIIARSGTQVVQYDIDGSNPRVLREAPEGGAITWVAVSADGTKIALTEEKERPSPWKGWAEITSVVFLDVESGREILVVPMSAPGFEGFGWEAWHVIWRDDGKGVVLLGSSNSDMPGGTATVLLDGSVRNHDVTTWLAAPNGRYVAEASLGTIMPCEIFIHLNEIALHDLDSGKALASVHNDELFLLPLEWSPDSTELLYATYSTRPAAEGECNPPKEGGVMHDQASERLYLLRTDGSPPEAVADIEAVHQGWYSDRHVRFFCLGKPVRGPWCSGERGESEPVDIYVGDILVGSGEGVEIVGFIDR
jgi:hypothetical protein